MLWSCFRNQMLGVWQNKQTDICAQRRLRSAVRFMGSLGSKPFSEADSDVSDQTNVQADVQADMSLRWSHRSFCWFYRAPAQKLLSVCELNSQFNIYNLAASWQNQQNDMCAQRRLRSAWASTKSDQSLRCVNRWLRAQDFFMRTAKTLIRIWVFAGHTCHFVGFVVGGSNSHWNFHFCCIA